jgi:diguanylate cyclase (GGDEF)-like protein/PAS domain S-box-containing protein
MKFADQGHRNPLILVADDDAVSRLLVRETLEQSEFTVVEVENGTDAVSVFARSRPELVVLDVTMPEMNGFDACAAIRRLPGGDNTPILMLTGLDDIESINKAYEAGATDFTTKPINWLVLSHRIRYMLRAKGTLEELRKSEARLANAQRIARLGHWERDLKSGRLLHWSDEIYCLFGITPDTLDLTHEKFLPHVHPEDRDLVVRAQEAALRKERPYSIDFRIVLPDGTVRFVHDQAEVVFDETGAASRMAGIIQDITARKQTEEQIRFLAYYDALTHLPNRALLVDRLKRALVSAGRSNRLTAILFLDLDRFKRINDTLGHSAGDKLLKGVADRLSKVLRMSDVIGRGAASNSSETVARVGGDEFIVLATDIIREADAAMVARRVLGSLNEPFEVDGHEIFVSGSIGISLYPHDGADSDTLLKSADSAMYHAKNAGGNSYQFYNSSLHTAAFQRLVLENNLRKALNRDEFLLHFQPQVDVASGDIVAAEALIRWRQPELGVVSPGDFIPLAEETGLILPIGEWVLRRACAHSKAWQEASYGPLRIAINVSGRHFWQDQIVHVVDEVVQATGLDPRSLELEITESVLMQSVAVNTLNQLKARGLRIAVDDFGTGYSSLSYLTRLPIDALKIDRSFVQNIGRDSRDAAVTETIITMARSLGIEVIAEGVEDAAQRAFLQQRGCRLMQGYLVGRPCPADEFEELLKMQARRRMLAADLRIQMLEEVPLLLRE